MGLWSRRPVARQADEPRFGWPGPRFALAQQSFSDIDASRIDTSLQSIAVRSAVDLIASLASELPVDVFRGRGQQRRQVPMPRWLEDPDGSGHGLPDWCYRVLMSWLLRGNLYGEELERGPGDILRQVEIFHPDAVSGHMEDGKPRWFVNGRPITGGFVHRRVNPIPGQVQGLSPISYHATTIGVSLASSQFGWQWFRDGAHPGGILGNEEVPLDKQQARTAKDLFLAALRGVREPLVLGKGWKFEQIQVNPDESQFLETMGYSEAQCARIFGPGIAEVLGYAVKGASLTYSNIADRDLHLLKYALNKWLRRLERLLSEFLPRPQYVQLNRDALLQTNTLQRYQAHASALDKRWMVVNEVREIEDLPPVDWGDEPNPTPGAAPEPAEDEEPPEDEDEE